MFRTGIQTNVWGKADHDERLVDILQAIAAAGYDGLEIGAHRLERYSPADFRRLAAGCGLQIAGLHTHGELANPQAMETTYPVIQKAAEYAAAAGADFVLISGKPMTAEAAALAAMAAALNRTGQICHAAGMHLLYHNHYWEIEHDAAILQHIVAATDPAEVSLALDVGWTQRAGASPAGITRRFIDRIRYFHFKDFRVKDFWTDTWTELGDGYVDFSAVFEVIRDRGDLWLTVERDEPLETAKAIESARTSAAYLKQLLAR